MKVKVSKSRAYREKQKKASAIKSGIKVGPEPTGKYEKNTPDYAIEQLMEQGLTQEEAVQLSQSLLKIRTVAIEYGEDVCCQMCGRKNYPVQKDGKKLQWSVERSLFLVHPSLTEEPRPHNSTILCEECLKEMIEEQYHANGTYAICNDGTCNDSVSEFGLVVKWDIENMDGVFSWLMRKYERDTEYYSLKTGMEIAQWLRNLWKSHLLYADGVRCQDKCYGMMCEHLGLPFDPVEDKIAAEYYIMDRT